MEDARAVGRHYHPDSLNDDVLRLHARIIIPDLPKVAAGPELFVLNCG